MALSVNSTRSRDGVHDRTGTSRLGAMQRLRVANIVLIAGVVAAWLVFRTPGDESADVPEDDRTVRAASATQPVGQRFEIQVDEVEPDFRDVTEPDIPDAVDPGSRDDAVADSDFSATDLRVWPVEPSVMEALIVQELAALADSGISSITSLECTATHCELRFVSDRSLSILIGPDSPFYETFASAPYQALVRVKARLIAPESWDRTVTLRSDGQTLEGLTGAALEAELGDVWRQAPVLPRRVADSFIRSTTVFASPMQLGRSADGAYLIGEYTCIVDCPQGVETVMYLIAEEGRTCAQMNGSERPMPTRNFSSQELEYRTFCLPNLLVEYY